MDEKISVRFPANHPVLNCAPGKRSQRVRELVDMALRLEGILYSLDSRMARIEDILVAGPVTAGRPAPENNDEKKPVVFDIEAFTEI